jgi:hypothetical protein
MPDPTYAPSHANHRRRHRLPCNGRGIIECRRASRGADLAVCALDISEAGVRLVLRAALVAGDVVEVVLSGAGVREPLRRRGRVAWSSPLAGGGACAGVSFDEPVPPADVQRLGRTVR